MTDSCSKFFENIAQPGRLAWLVFRSIARFWAAIFLPYFRVWGETEFKAGSIIVARNFGLQTWIYCLRFFRRPVRIVLVDDNDDLKWFKVAEDVKTRFSEKLNYKDACKLTFRIKTLEDDGFLHGN